MRQLAMLAVAIAMAATTAWCDGSVPVEVQGELLDWVDLVVPPEGLTMSPITPDMIIQGTGLNGVPRRATTSSGSMIFEVTSNHAVVVSLPISALLEGPGSSAYAVNLTAALVTGTTVRTTQGAYQYIWLDSGDYDIRLTASTRRYWTYQLVAGDYTADVVVDVQSQP